MKKILVYRWNAYNYDDIIANFRRLGYEVEVVSYYLKNYDQDEVLEGMLEERLKTGGCAFVFTVNYFALIAEVCHIWQVPYVSWTCDNPLISMHHNSVFYDTNIIFTFDQTNYAEFKEMGVEHIYYLPLAVDVERIRHTLDAATDAYLYENEVSFVGGLYERNSYDRMEKHLPDYLRGYFDGVMRIQSDLYGSSIVEDALTVDILAEIEGIYDLKKSPESFSDLGLIFSTTTLGYKIAQIERKEGLMALARHLPVSIYSNSDTTDLLGVTYRGSVDYFGEMPKVFARSKINLNFTIPNIKSGLPLRIWDILGSGGFLLTNFQAETPLYFKEGEELVSFYSREDMVEKAMYYYARPELRQKIAARGQEVVGKYHSYEVRMRKMLEQIEGVTGNHQIK